MQLILVMGGSLGDHMPMLQVAREASRRGHRVVALGCEKYLAGVDDANISVRPITSTAEYEQFCESVAHDKPRAQLAMFRKIAARDLVRTYDALRELDSLEETVIMVPKFPMGLGARIIGEQFGVPVTEFQFDPMPMSAGWMGWGRRLFLLFHDAVVNRMFGPDVNAFRRKIGLLPLRNMCHWADEQLQLICGLYPEWIGRALRFDDREQRFLFAGFAGLQGFSDLPLPPVVEEFLAAGSPPILVSQSSWAEKQTDFVKETEEALARIGARGIFTGFENQSSSTPSNLYFPFLPHGQILPRVSAFIHHGGAGTSAVSLAAGVPQLIVPRLPMQRDFGKRLELLQVGRVVSPRSYRAGRVARLLSELVNSPTIRARCQESAELLRQDGADGARITCDAMQILLREAPRRQAVRDVPANVEPVGR